MDQLAGDTAHPETLELAVAARPGYDAIAHINQLMLGWLLEPGEDTRTPLRLTAMKRAATLDLDSPQVSKTVALMRDHGTALDTTAVILERLMLSRAGRVQPGDRPYLAHMPIGYQRYRKRSFVAFKSPEHEATYVKSFRKLLDVIAYFHQQGVQLLPGTDDGTGFTVHRELELYVQAGEGNVTGTAFYLDPNELPSTDGDNELAGFDLRYDDPAGGFMHGILNRLAQ